MGAAIHPPPDCPPYRPGHRRKLRQRAAKEFFLNAILFLDIAKFVPNMYFCQRPKCACCGAAASNPPPLRPRPPPVIPIGAPALGRGGAERKIPVAGLRTALRERAGFPPFVSLGRNAQEIFLYKIIFALLPNRDFPAIPRGPGDSRTAKAQKNTKIKTGLSKPAKGTENRRKTAKNDGGNGERHWNERSKTEGCRPAAIRRSLRSAGTA